MRLGLRFETITGTLRVRFDGTTLGTVTAPATVADSFGRERFLVDGALLGQTGDLEIELDGPAGSKVLIDDVVFPGIADGDFQQGGAAAWTTSGNVSVLVPEPGAVGAGAVAGLLLAILAALRSRGGRPVARDLFGCGSIRREGS